MFHRSSLGLLVVLAITFSCTAAPLKSHLIQFYPISQQQYDNILGITSGQPVISEGRLISSGFRTLNDLRDSITSDLRTGLRDILNVTGILPLDTKANKDKVSGYPLCVIKTNDMDYTDNDDDVEQNSSEVDTTLNQGRAEDDDSIDYKESNRPVVSCIVVVKKKNKETHENPVHHQQQQQQHQTQSAENSQTTTQTNQIIPNTQTIASPAPAAPSASPAPPAPNAQYLRSPVMPYYYPPYDYYSYPVYSYYNYPYFPQPRQYFGQGLARKPSKSTIRRDYSTYFAQARQNMIHGDARKPAMKVNSMPRTSDDRQRAETLSSGRSSYPYSYRNLPSSYYGGCQGGNRYDPYFERNYNLNYINNNSNNNEGDDGNDNDHYHDDDRDRDDERDRNDDNDDDESSSEDTSIDDISGEVAGEIGGFGA